MNEGMNSATRGHWSSVPVTVVLGVFFKDGRNTDLENHAVKRKCEIPQIYRDICTPVKLCQVFCCIYACTHNIVLKLVFILFF